MIRSNVRRWFHLALRRRDRWERDVEDEIKLHLALRAEQLMAEGADANDALREAVRRFGPLKESRSRLLAAAHHREQRMQRTEYFDDLRHDIAFALRTLGRQKAWTFVTVATMALGIGATTAVFSVVSTLLLHPLPYPDADRIVYVSQQPGAGNNTGMRVSITPSSSVVRAWMKHSRSFESIEGSQTGPRAMKTGGEPSTVNVESVFPTFAQWAGQRPILGRMFTQADVDAGMPVVVLSEGFWRTRLASSRAVLGQRLTLGDSMFTIVGVLPAALGDGTGRDEPVDLWIPLDIRNDKLGMSVIGRLRPGVAARAAAAELDSIYARTNGFTNGRLPFDAVVNTPAERVSFRDSLMLLTAAVGLVLLVACANVAHLLLGRASARQREMAIRAALGAGRGRVFRQLLTEGSILSIAGATAGVFVGWAGLKGLVALRPNTLDELRLAHLDLTTLGVAITVAVVTGVAFGLMGAAHAARASTNDALKNGAPSVGGRRVRARGLLVVSEMALSATLLVGAALLVRSVINLQRADLGFDTSNLYALTIRLEAPQFNNEAARTQALREFTSRLRSMPGIRSATIAAVAPGSRRFTVGRLQAEGEAPPPDGTMEFIDVNSVERSYFATMDMTMRQGSTFTDTTRTAQQVIVNESFARKHWSGSALGHRIRVLQRDAWPWLTIVGVVRDAHTSGPLSESAAPMLYYARAETGNAPVALVRTTGGAEPLAAAALLLNQLGVRRPPPIRSVGETISRSIAAPRFVMLLLTILTVLALSLAAIGLYGVMSYAVAEQTREIGIRVALGATGDRIAKRVVGAAASLALVGAAIGLGVAAWGTRLIETQLHGIERLDPASYAVGALVLIAAALVAAIVPTRRALAVDPVTAIRAE